MPILPNADPWIPSSPNSPPCWPAAAVKVYRYKATGSPTWTLLPNVECLRYEKRQGSDPGRALFRYRWGTGDPNAPQGFEQCLDSSYTLSGIVTPADRLVVKVTRFDGTDFALFDGFPMEFGFDLDPDTEDVHIVAYGVAIRLRDQAIPGATVRAADAPTDTTKDLDTDLVAHFNPRGVGNALMPDTSWATSSMTAGPASYPTFIDPDLADTTLVGEWTLPMVARYYFYKLNKAEAFVESPVPSVVDSVLVAREPLGGGVTFDPTDATTYNAVDVVVPDKPVTGKDWPNQLHDMIGDKGFGMRVLLSLDTLTGKTRNKLEVFLQQTGAVKDVWLQPRGNALDLLYSNINRGALDRRLTDVANEWYVDGALKQYEASLVLALGFAPNPSDYSATDPTPLAAFDKADPNFPANRDGYRLFLFDEAGEGHYIYGSTTLFHAAGNLGPVLGTAGTDFVKRRRKPLGRLISADADDKPLKYRLSYSTDYAGSVPAVWDGTGTWKFIEGGYRLLKTRIGIYVDVTNPHSWNVGKEPGAPNSVELKTVQALAAPDAYNPRFFLRLTCVIEGDKVVSGHAARTDASPLSQTVTRRIDARDRYKLQTIHYPSELNSVGSDLVLRDDSAAATAEATAVKQATEAGVLGGSVTIPYMTMDYEVGDRIRSIQGRGLGLRTDNASGTSTTPVYPVVVGVDYDLVGGQGVTLHMSDASVDRRRQERAVRLRRPKA